MRFNLSELSMKKMLKIEPTFHPNKILLVLALGGIIMGMDITSLSIFLEDTNFTDTFGIPTPLQQGLLIGSTQLGGLIGCLIYGMLVSKKSRLYMFKLGSILWLNGSLFGIFAKYFWMVIFSRFKKGVSIGIFSILLGAYVTEIYPKTKKGKITGVIQLAYTSAILSTYYVCILLVKMNLKYSFRIAWALEIIPAIGLFISTHWLPESPQWLTLHGDYAEALDIQNKLADVFNQNYNIPTIPKYNKLEMALLYGEGINKFKYKELFAPNCWRQTLMGFTLQILVQVSGINILMFYIIYICDMLGLQGNAKIVSASMPYIINMLLTFLPIAYLDHIKRKHLTLGGSFALAAIMYIIGIVMAMHGHKVEPLNGNQTLVWEVDEKGGPVILGCCFFFVAIFSLTLSCGPLLYTNEILPTKAKPKGFALCMAVSWLTNFALTFLGPLMMTYIKWGTFVLLGGLTFIVSIIILLFFPETKDMTVEQIDALYGGNEFKYEDNDDKGMVMENEYPVTPKPSTDPFEPIKMTILDTDDLKSV